MREIFPSKLFEIGVTYQRKDVDKRLDEASVNRNSGVFPFSNGLVLFVTLDKSSKPDHHKFKDFFEGSNFYWESQPPKATFGRPTTPLMSKLLSGETTAFLFARIRPKFKSVTLPYFYCGKLKVVSWDDAAEEKRPFGVHFQCLEISDQTGKEFKNLLEWKPDHVGDISEAKMLASIAPRIKNDASSIARGQGRETDPRLRKSIENFATQKAIAHYTNLGYKIRDVSQEKLGYDMYCEKDNSHRLVEIKGTRGSGWTVTVTSNEVEIAGTKDVDLFIVNKIKIAGVNAGEYICEGGEVLCISPWIPRSSQSTLKATEYQFTPK